MNESKRQQKFSRLIQKDISEIIQRDKMGIFSRSFVTVAAVKMSPDLSMARIYLSMLTEGREEMLRKIDLHKSEIRRELGNRIGKQVRIVPELFFYMDELEERASRLDKIIDSLDIPSSEEDEES